MKILNSNYPIYLLYLHVQLWSAVEPSIWLLYPKATFRGISDGKILIKCLNSHIITD